MSFDESKKNRPTLPEFLARETYRKLTHIYQIFIAVSRLPKIEN
jgi:hypothetical protein